MKENDKDKSNENNQLPTVSGPTPEQVGAFSVPPPQIEGYEIIGEVGEAGQGRVWRARQLSTHRDVALNVPRVDLLTSRKALARFEQKVELVAHLKHPNIARICDSGIYQGLYYYAMERLIRTLRQRLRPMGSFNDQKAIEQPVFGQILRWQKIKLTHNT